jgi:hypothetical protein
MVTAQPHPVGRPVAASSTPRFSIGVYTKEFSLESELLRELEVAGNRPASPVDASHADEITYEMLSGDGRNCTRSSCFVKACHLGLQHDRWSATGNMSGLRDAPAGCRDLAPADTHCQRCDHGMGPVS